jgi:hypothetical protein
MNINEIITEAEYTKERSAKELFEWMTLKYEEMSKWSADNPKLKYTVLNKGLPKKFIFELIPFAYYANNYYSGNSKVMFKPCSGSEQYDGIIIDNANKAFVEITYAVDGKISGLQDELLMKTGHSPWEHNILGVKDNKTKRKRSVNDIIISEDSPPHTVIIDKIKTTVKTAISEKCKKSLEQTLPYQQNKTILIGTFNNTVVRPSINKKDWNYFVTFKQTEIDSMEHNFIKIILFGWIDRSFID